MQKLSQYRVYRFYSGCASIHQKRRQQNSAHLGELGKVHFLKFEKYEIFSLFEYFILCRLEFYLTTCFIMNYNNSPKINFFGYSEYLFFHT